METKALSPALGVEVIGIDSLDDEAVVARCLKASKWRGVLLIRGLPSTTRLRSHSAASSDRYWPPQGRKFSRSRSSPARTHRQIPSGHVQLAHRRHHQQHAGQGDNADGTAQWP